MPDSFPLAVSLPSLGSLLAAMWCGSGLRAQQPLPQDPDQPRIVVTAARAQQDSLKAARSVDVITREELDRLSARSLPQALRELPSVMVQETAPGQGSPYLRGFTGYSNLLLIDGIRLNNSAFRSGPNQYWATIDPLSIDHLEVLRGPSATLYGSDAVGGTVQVFTKSPTKFGAGTWEQAGALQTRYASAENSLTGRIEVQSGQQWADGSRTGFLLGGSARSLGDLEGGDATGTQPETGYSESAVDFKVEHWFDNHSRLVLLHQRMSQDAVPRTHATVFGRSYAGTTVGTDLQRDNYQDRYLSYLQYHRTDLGGGIDAMHFSVSWHEQSQTEDRIKSNSSQQIQGFRVGTLGLLAQLESDLGAAGRLSYGIDYYRDDVDSFNSTNAIQGPVGDNARYDLLGLFVQDVLPVGDRTEVQLGVRYSYASADADKVRDPISQNQVAMERSWSKLTGSANASYALIQEHLHLYGGVNQAFRAPSLSDLTSFDIARSGEQEQAATGLDEENYLGFELGTKVRSEALQGQLAWFRTEIDDQIQRFPTATPNVVEKANVGDGYLTGVELQFAWEFAPRTTLIGANTWQYGRVENYGSGATLTEEFPSRLMPLSTVLGVRWEDETGRFYASTNVVHAEDADKLSSGDLRDTQRIPPGGTPGYTIWNLRAGCKVSDRTDFELGVDNLTDVDYRVHGSGSNAPGTNLILSMRTTF